MRSTYSPVRPRGSPYESENSSAVNPCTSTCRMKFVQVSRSNDSRCSLLRKHNRFDRKNCYFRRLGFLGSVLCWSRISPGARVPIALSSSLIRARSKNHQNFPRYLVVSHLATCARTIVDQQEV
jgi:hypothetical protein